MAVGKMFVSLEGCKNYGECQDCMQAGLQDIRSIDVLQNQIYIKLFVNIGLLLGLKVAL